MKQGLKIKFDRLGTGGILYPCKATSLTSFATAVNSTGAVDRPNGSVLIGRIYLECENVGISLTGSVLGRGCRRP